jgi:hypothetical protein
MCDVWGSRLSSLFSMSVVVFKNILKALWWQHTWRSCDYERQTLFCGKMHNRVEWRITRLVITWTEGLHQESSVNEGAPHYWSAMVIGIAEGIGPEIWEFAKLDFLLTKGKTLPTLCLTLPSRGWFISYDWNLIFMVLKNLPHMDSGLKNVDKRP